MVCHYIGIAIATAIQFILLVFAVSSDMCTSMPVFFSIFLFSLFLILVRAALDFYTVEFLHFAVVCWENNEIFII